MIKKDFFQLSRRNFFEKMDINSIALFYSKDRILKGDSEFFDFPDVNLFYISGIVQPESIVVLYKDSKGNCFEVAFIKKSSKKVETWEGKKLSLNNVKKISGIFDVRYLEEFNNFIDNFEKSKYLFYFYFEDGKFFSRDAENLHNKLSQGEIQIKNSYEILKGLRQFKRKEEIYFMKKALKATEKGFLNIISNMKSYRNEKEIEAVLTYTYTKDFCFHSYHPIVASGINACVLHYISNDKLMKAGDLVLIDTGAEFFNYKSDITRTLPISGHFSKRQSEVYQACLNVQKFAIKSLKPGLNRKVWEKKVHFEMAKALFNLRVLSRKDFLELEKAFLNNSEDIGKLKSFEKLKEFYPHSTGHFLGLDTHDIGDYSTPFSEGDVFTVEPGIYIKSEKIGVRIEDNVLITKTGRIVLSKNIPKEIKDIERLMR